MSIGKRHTNVKSTDLGNIVIPFSFASGAAEDGTFPDSLLDDGYISALGDGYGISQGVNVDNGGVRGKGVHGVARKAIGLYEIVLRDQWLDIVSVNFQLQLEQNKDLKVQLAGAPQNITTTDSDGRSVKRTILQLRIINSSAVETDLEYNDRVHGQVWVNNSLTRTV